MNNKTILITGGTGKIGFKLVNHFVSKGYKVVFISRYQSNIDSLIGKIADGFKDNLFGIPINLEEKDSSKKIIDILEHKNIYINILINNARNIEYLKISDELRTDREAWAGEFLLDVIVPYELSIDLANQVNSELSNIINISSMYGVVAANPNLYNDSLKESPINYSVAKAALIHLTRELSIRFAGKAIRVNSISFGGVEGRVSEEFKWKYGKLCPMGRMLKEDEVIGSVDFLVSDNSIGMIGHNLVVDGGWTIW
ncbi:MAG: SDR family oxidoreductase [Candidatus Eremiobacterota bacterium]